MFGINRDLVKSSFDLDVLERKYLMHCMHVHPNSTLIFVYIYEVLVMVTVSEAQADFHEEVNEP